MLELYRRVMEQFGGLVGIQVLRRALAQVHDLKGALLVVDRNKFRIRRR